MWKERKIMHFKVNHQLKFLELSATTGRGMDQWYQWLENEREVWQVDATLFYSIVHLNWQVKASISKAVFKGRIQAFVYRLAMQYQLTGWVKNGSDGVHIQVAGPEDALNRFCKHLQIKPPPLAIITGYSVHDIEYSSYNTFQILESSDSGPGEVC